MLVNIGVRRDNITCAISKHHLSVNIANITFVVSKQLSGQITALVSSVNMVMCGTFETSFVSKLDVFCRRVQDEVRRCRHGGTSCSN